jgi:hypothetical protein
MQVVVTLLLFALIAAAVVVFNQPAAPLLADVRCG